MTTSARRHSRAPLRRSSTPEKIISTGLAAATCVGIVGVIGMRTIDYNASASADTSAAAPSAASAAAANVEPVAVAEPLAATTTGGLTREQLDAYAASLAAEKKRLDDYREKLIRTAKKLQAAARSRAGASAPRTTRQSNRSTTARSGRTGTSASSQRRTSQRSTTSRSTTRRSTSSSTTTSRQRPTAAKPVSRPARVTTQQVSAPAAVARPAPATNGGSTTKSS